MHTFKHVHWLKYETSKIFTIEFNMSLTFAQDIQGSTEMKDVHSDKLKRRKQISPNYISQHVF